MQINRVWTGALVLAVALAAAMPMQAMAKKQSGTPSWMNADGEVTNSSQVEAGYGETVKGVNDYEGEITGKPAPDSKFTQLKIGMPMKQVTDLIGEPTDQGSYVTGKAFIPFFYGGDRYRYELAYKGQGRLVFAGKSMGSGGNLIWIIHNKNDSGYRE